IQVPVNEDQIALHLPKILERFGEMSKEDILKRFVSLEFNKILEYYQHAPDLNAELHEGRPVRGEKNARFSNHAGGDDRYGRNGYKSDYTRLFINLGAMDQFSRGDMLGFICDNSRIPGKAVGKIDVKGV